VHGTVTSSNTHLGGLSAAKPYTPGGGLSLIPNPLPVFNPAVV